MTKKRLIFTLIYKDGKFTLSRNFRLQEVGDSEWINKNYGFSEISGAIDELIILNATREGRNIHCFCEDVQNVFRNCFIPIALGGGVRSPSDAETMLDYGADKVVVNTSLAKDPEMVKGLVETYGSQFVVASIDYKKENGSFNVYTHCGRTQVPFSLREMVENVQRLGVGEIYLNSIDRDGTGDGYFLKGLQRVQDIVSVPIILAGGAGNYHHLLEGIRHPGVETVAASNLFNFVGDGLPRAREALIREDVPLAEWEKTEITL